MEHIIIKGIAFLCAFSDNMLITTIEIFIYKPSCVICK